MWHPMTVAAHKQNRSSPDVGGGAGGAGARAGGYLTNVLIRKDYQPLLSHSPFNLQPHVVQFVDNIAALSTASTD